MLDEEYNTRLPEHLRSHITVCALRKVGFIFLKGHKDSALLIITTHWQGLWGSLGSRCTIDIFVL